MRTIAPEPFNVYTYDELSDDAKKRAEKQMIIESYTKAQRPNLEFHADGTFFGTYYGDR